jgi:hypothetical protein
MASPCLCASKPTSTSQRAYCWTSRGYPSFTSHTIDATFKTVSIALRPHRYFLDCERYFQTPHRSSRTGWLT